MDNSDLTLTGGSGNNGYASIYTDAGGNITAYFSDDSIIDAGSSYAEINAGKSSGSGNIYIGITSGIRSDESFGITGGDATTTNRFGRIFANNGNIEMSLSGTLNLTGGTADNGAAYIATNTGNITLNIQGGTFQGGNATGSDTGIFTRYSSGTGGNIEIDNDEGGTIYLKTGTTNGGKAAIEVISGTGSITTSSYGSYSLIAQGDGADAYIKTANGPITMQAKHLTMRANESLGDSNAYIETTGHNININLLGSIFAYSGSAANSNVHIEPLVSGNLTLNANYGFLSAGSSGTDSDAYFRTTGGSISLLFATTFVLSSSSNAQAFVESSSSLNLVADNFYMFGTDATNYTYVKAGGLTIHLLESLYTYGTSHIGNTSGELNILAGKNVNLLESTSVINGSSGRLNIVVDNDYPLSPKYGEGYFKLDPSASITSTGDLRIYMSQYLLNTISGILNGSSYTGLIDVSDSHNFYQVYFPNGSYNSPYSVYYKVFTPWDHELLVADMELFEKESRRMDDWVTHLRFYNVFQNDERYFYIENLQYLSNTEFLEYYYHNKNSDFIRKNKQRLKKILQ